MNPLNPPSPRRGEIWFVHLPAHLRDPHQPRPGLVISEDSRNQRRDDLLVIPAYSTARLGPTRIPLREGLGGIPHDSVLFCELITAVHRDLLTSGPLGPAVPGWMLEDVVKAVREPAHPIIFYDGVCGLCDGFVQFVLRRDEGGIFRFAPLQSDFARETLTPWGKDPRDLESVYVLAEGRVLARAEAVLYVLGKLGGRWAALALLRALPGPALDVGYRLVARWRYLLFGRYEACPVPDERWRSRFVDGSPSP